MEVIRGDSYAKMFARKSGGAVIKTRADKVYFTVKKNHEAQNFIFQKTIDDMRFDQNGYYHFDVEPADTDGLPYGDYVYDIEIIVGDDYKKTINKEGLFRVLPEVTHVLNEG